MIIHGWKFEKKKVDCSRKDQVKKKKKKNGLEKKNRKEVEVQFELYYVKLVELMIFEKKKLCSTSL